MLFRQPGREEVQDRQQNQESKGQVGGVGVEQASDDKSHSALLAGLWAEVTPTINNWAAAGTCAGSETLAIGVGSNAGPALEGADKGTGFGKA